MKSKTGLIALTLLAFLNVTNALAQDCATADLAKDLNVICKEKDFNGFGLDPDWAEHVRNGTFPLSNSKDACYQNPALGKCTSETTSIDEARAPNLALCFFGCLNCIHGHVNWQPATFTGQIGWLNFADDWDFNFELLRDDQIGLAWNNAQVKLGGETRRIMELEFASGETVEKFTTDWWSTLYQTALSLDFDKISRQFNPSCPSAPPRGVVFGEFGLDCEHGCRSEIHPVYAVAIETDPSADNNTWAIFARNWGNEGYCSHLNHTLDTDTIRILLPRNTTGTPEILTSPGTSEFASTDSISFPEVNNIAGQGLVLTFHLGPPENRGVAEMLLKVKWTNDNAPIPQCSHKSAVEQGKVARYEFVGGNATENGEADTEFGKLYKQATGKTPQTTAPVSKHDDFYLQSVSVFPQKTEKKELPSHVTIQSGAPGVPSKTPAVISVFDSLKQSQDEAAMAVICDAQKNGKVTISNKEIACPVQRKSK
jgi:hypothetical protein